MRTCPTCGARYEPPAQFCQRDGVPLRVDESPRDHYLGTRILEQFRLEKVLGSGGMGVVYQGWDEGLGRRVAVKILHRDLITNKDIVARFHREAQIAHQLDHPGIVRVILFGQLPDGNLYLVLEFLEGPTLLEVIERDGAMIPERAVKITGQVADAIGYTHARGIIHRDLKPENVVLTRRDDDTEFPKVLDFGIAKTIIGNASFVTQTGLIFGTARYISPEGAAGENVDARSDVYSLAVMAYQLLAGRTPFEADEPVQLLMKHMHENAPRLRKWPAAAAVPPAVEDVVMRALAKNPEARPDTAGDFGKLLRAALVVPGTASVGLSTLVSPATAAARAAQSAPEQLPARTTLDRVSTEAAPAIQSLVPTSSMPLFNTGSELSPQSLDPLGGTLDRISSVPVPRRSTQPAPSPAPSEHSGIARIRTVVHAGTPSGGAVLRAEVSPVMAPGVVAASDTQADPVQLSPSMHAEAAPANGVNGTTSGVRPSEPLPARVEIPRVDPQALAPEAVRTLGPDVPAAVVTNPDDDDDDLQVPGLSKKRKTTAPAPPKVIPPEALTVTGIARPRSAWRTFALVVSVGVLSFGAAAGGAWALRLYPSQQRHDQLVSLMQRAEDAWRAGRLMHSPDGNDVEDLTDAVLALDPQHRRARQLREAGALRLQNSATAERNAEHPERAIPLLQEALRLHDARSIRDDLAAAQREDATLRARTAPPPRAAPANPSRSVMRPAVPRPATGPTAPTADPTQPTQPTATPNPDGVTFTPGRDGNSAAPTAPTAPTARRSTSADAGRAGTTRQGPIQQVLNGIFGPPPRQSRTQPPPPEPLQQPQSPGPMDMQPEGPPRGEF